jgi:3-dehydroquinate dehydratase-2
MSAPRILGLLHGPNLGRLGRREPAVYGTTTLAEIEETVQGWAAEVGCELRCAQSNCQGTLLDRIEEWTDAGVAGLIVNPGGLTHTSVALRDSIAGSGLPVVEVHLSHTPAREEFRHRSLTAPVCRGMITGLGVEGYRAAVRYLAALTEN